MTGMVDTLKLVDLENLMEESLSCEFESPTTGERCEAEAEWILICGNPTCSYKILLCNNHAGEFKKAMIIAPLIDYVVVCELCDQIMPEDFEKLLRKI